MKHRAGFTLVEVVVVLGIILVLYGVVMPVLRAARLRAKETECGSNLRQCFLALRMYHDDYGEFPPAAPVGAPETLYGAYVTDTRVYLCPLEFRDLVALDPNLPGRKAKVQSSYFWPCLPNPEREAAYAKRGDDMPAVACLLHVVVQSGPPFHLIVRLNGSLHRVPVDRGRASDLYTE